MSGDPAPDDSAVPKRDYGEGGWDCGDADETDQELCSSDGDGRIVERMPCSPYSGEIGRRDSVGDREHKRHQHEPEQHKSDGDPAGRCPPRSVVSTGLHRVLLVPKPVRHTARLRTIAAAGRSAITVVVMYATRRGVFAFACTAVVIATVTSCSDSSEFNSTGGSTTPSATTSSSSATPRTTATAAASDHGPQEAATGVASKGPNGFDYTVAPGDTVVGIAGRFALCTADVYLANEDQEVLGHELTVGQHLTIRRMPGPGHSGTECNEAFPAGVY